MNTTLRLSASLLALVAMTGTSFAADLCARPDEAMALKTAAVQQELMVAALTCGDADSYNRFVLSHRGALQDSDAALKSYFQRASERRGEDEYNSYKTALANGFSLASLRGQGDFCRTAEAVFEDSQDSRSLSAFVAEQRISGGDNYPACETRSGGGGASELVAGGSSARRTRD
jgi:hypothetical protein